MLGSAACSASCGRSGAKVFVVIPLAVVSVFLVIGPKLLGNATNVIFEGVVGRQFPAG